MASGIWRVSSSDAPTKIPEEGILFVKFLVWCTIIWISRLQQSVDLTKGDLPNGGSTRLLPPRYFKRSLKMSVAE
jgi:hypothetical protein